MAWLAEGRALISEAASRQFIDIFAAPENPPTIMKPAKTAQMPSPTVQFRDGVAACAGPASPRFELAELNSLLSGLNAAELRDAIAVPPAPGLGPFLSNYIAAMVEYACARRSVAVPAWTGSIAPLTEPVFGSELKSLRPYLLANSPPQFRARNIFIDSTVGDRV
jgi:hypothetical protein